MSHLFETGPKKGDPQFDTWDEQDSMIMSWLWILMTHEISDTCMFLTIAKGIWDVVHQIYSKALDTTQVYEIKAKIEATK